MRPPVPEVDGVVPMFGQPSDHSDIDAHVGEKPHVGPPLRRPHLLFSKPRGISQSMLDVLTFKIGVSFHSLIDRRAVRELSDDDRDWNAHASDASPSAHDLRVGGDPVEGWDFLIPPWASVQLAFGAGGAD